MGKSHYRLIYIVDMSIVFCAYSSSLLNAVHVLKNISSNTNTAPLLT